MARGKVISAFVVMLLLTIAGLDSLYWLSFALVMNHNPSRANFYVWLAGMIVLGFVWTGLLVFLFLRWRRRLRA